MSSLDLPKLRALSTQKVRHRGKVFVVFEDPLRVFTEPVLIPFDGYDRIIRHFDGKTPLAEVQAKIRRDSGSAIPFPELEDLVEQLDQAMVLDGPTFAAYDSAYRRQPVRTAAFAGRAYAGTPHALRAQLARFFTHADGSGPPQPGPVGPSDRLRGILSPHIDFERGGPVYTWSYKELVERSGAGTFVILGVAHSPCRRRFALTRKDFATPLGLARTDQDFVAAVAAEAGAGLFDDELAHRIEHSIEFQVVFLQYLLGDRRDYTIVPILVGSFHDLMEQGIDPIESPEIRRFVDALRSAEAASGKSVTYIGGIDLCHVGPEFGDPEPVDRGTLDLVRGFDATMLERAAANDPAGWFGVAADVGNRWRVCGLAATYTMLHAMGPARGRILKYNQAVDDRRTCCVSFASLAFDRLDLDGVAAEAERS
jgi:AmmeMemoRadiSam system protein B